MRATQVFRSMSLVIAAALAAAAVADDEPLPPITVPEGFTATVFHPGLGPTRHLAVRDNGDVYVARSFRVERRMFGQKAAWGTLIAMRDEDGDATADAVEPFGPTDVTTEVRIHDRVERDVPHERVVSSPAQDSGGPLRRRGCRRH